ncbi:MAG: nucleotide exchange factor GrpE [Nitrospirota bacterium]
MGDKRRKIDIEGQGSEETRGGAPEEGRETGAEEAPRREVSEEELAEAEAAAAAEEAREAEGPSAEERLAELDERYVRLYAEFENYKKKSARDREELARYVREELVYDLMPSLDHLEIALQHAVEQEDSAGLKQGVEMTLRELYRTLEKYGLKSIEALGQPFDPEYHHAISQAERDDIEEGTVVEVFRKGYMLGDKVLRAAMVSVSRKPEGH